MESQGKVCNPFADTSLTQGADYQFTLDKATKSKEGNHRMLCESSQRYSNDHDFLALSLNL